MHHAIWQTIAAPAHRRLSSWLANLVKSDESVIFFLHLHHQEATSNGSYRSEIRRHFGGLDRAHQERRPARGGISQARGHQIVVVVVSAMSGVTDNLIIGLSKEIHAAARASVRWTCLHGHGRAGRRSALTVDGVALHRYPGVFRHHGCAGGHRDGRPLTIATGEDPEHSVDRRQVHARRPGCRANVVIVAGFQGHRRIRWSASRRWVVAVRILTASRAGGCVEGGPLPDLYGCGRRLYDGSAHVVPECEQVVRTIALR